jgi:hypothetical protein
MNPQSKKSPSGITRLTGWMSIVLVALILTIPLTIIATGSSATQEGYTPPAGWNGKVVLAELFTGSECPPCLGADLGFDRLLEHYPNSVLAVLQYHEHVPLPDPMANPHTRTRIDFYGARGTPAVYIDGRGVGVGGGPAEAAEQLYGIYRARIENQLKEDPLVEINLNARRSGTTVRILAEVRALEHLRVRGGLRLHFALVENELAYRGYNDLPLHKMVVRYLIGGPNGHEVDFTDGTFSIEQEADVAEISAWLDEYLTDFEARNTGGRWPGFSMKMHEIDPANLTLVAFVQEGQRSHILQAKVVELE